MVGFEIFHLILSDAVLAGEGPVHRHHPRGETIDEFLNLSDFLRAVRVDQRQCEQTSRSRGIIQNGDVQSSKWPLFLDAYSSAQEAL